MKYTYNKFEGRTSAVCTSVCYLPTTEVSRELKPGDTFELELSDGTIIKSSVMDTSLVKECPRLCPFMRYEMCFILPCNDRVRFGPYDPMLDLKSKMINAGEIRNRLCNSDACIYYEDECNKFLTDESNCLLKIILGDERI